MSEIEKMVSDLQEIRAAVAKLSDRPSWVVQSFRTMTLRQRVSLCWWIVRHGMYLQENLKCGGSRLWPPSALGISEMHKGSIVPVPDALALLPKKENSSA